MQNQDNNMAPRSVGDLDINVWVTRYERNRNIVPAGLPRFFLGEIVKLRRENEELEFRLEQRTEALTQLMEVQKQQGAAARKPVTGSKKIKKKDED